MRGNRETRAGTAIPTRAVENGTVCETGHASTKNDTTISGCSQMGLIAGLLQIGQQNAVPLRYLKELTGLPGRTVRRMIERERRAGALILSDNQRGYCLAADEAEAERFTRSMQHRAWEIMKTAAAIKEAARFDYD